MVCLAGTNSWLMIRRGQNNATFICNRKNIKNKCWHVAHRAFEANKTPDRYLLDR